MSRAGPRSHKGGPPLIVLEVAWGVFRDPCRGQWGDGWRGWGGVVLQRLGGVPLPCALQVSFFLPPTAGQRQGWGGRWNLNVPADSRPGGRSVRQSWPACPVPWLELRVPGAHSAADVGVGHTDVGVGHTEQPGPLSRLTEHLPVFWWLGGVVSELAKGTLVHSHRGLKSWLGDSAGGSSVT